MPGDKIRVGIIGANVDYGWGTRAHLPALTALPDYEVRAVCTNHRETAEATAQKFGIPLAFDNVEALVSDPEIDLVSVCVRVPSHYALAHTALQAGKHVFCEWPLGANLAEAVALRDLAQAKGVRTMVGLQARGAPVLNYVKHLVEDGSIGQLVSCRLLGSSSGAGQRSSGNAWMADRANGANSFTIQGGHSIDAFRFCLGEFAELAATVATQVPQTSTRDTGARLETTSPDQVLANGRLRSGALALIHIQSVPVHGSGFLLEVYGTEGMLRVSADAGANVGDLALSGATKGDAQVAPMPVPGEYTRVPADVPAGAPFNVAQIFQTLAGSIRDGSPASPDFGTAVQLHELLDAMERSSETGQRQRL